MRYFRMLSDSLLVGLVASTYLTLLFLLLNPDVPITFAAAMPFLLVVGLSYGAALAALVYLLFVARQRLSQRPLLPAWVSLRMLAWASGASSVATGALLWFNVSGYRTTLAAPLLQPLFTAAAVLAAGGCVMLVLALTRTVVQRAPVFVGVAYGITALATLAAPLLLRDGAARDQPVVSGGPPVSTPAAASPRVFLLLLDGASLEVISPAVAAGRLPSLARLLEDGASMHLATTRPTQPEPVWTTVATGKWPSGHGIRSAAAYRPFIGGRALQMLPDLLFAQALVRTGLLVEQPPRPADLRAQPFWEILGRQGVPTAVIGLPLGPPVAGAAALPLVDVPVLEALDGDVRRMVQDDQAHHAFALRAGAAPGVRVVAVRYAGVDAVAHVYLRYAQPEAFGDVTDDERRRFGRVLDDYYAYLDGRVGEMLRLLAPEDLLLVVSGFGMEPLSPTKRLLERLAGNGRFSGTHERGPDGFLLAIGGGVARGRFARGALVDVLPTLLYFLDEPVARDMDGFARTDLFTEAFNARHAITVIPSYDPPR